MTISTPCGAGRRRARLAALALTTILSSGIAAPALAQLTPAAPVRQSIDANGVDLFAGTLNLDAPALTMGQADQGLSFNKFNRGSGWTDNIIAAIDLTGSVATVSLGGISDSFSVSGSTYTSTEGNGATLTFNSGTSIYTYTRADGTVMRFDKVRSGAYPFHANLGRVIDVTSPSGTKLTYSYDSLYYCVASKPGGGGDICTQHSYAYRIAAVTSSFGYRLTPAYAEIEPFDPDSTYDGPNLGLWATTTGVVASNLATTSTSRSQSFGASVVGGTTYYSVTDAAGAITNYRYSGGSLAGVIRPGSTSDDVTFAYSGGRVSSVTTAAGTVSYASSDASGVRTVTVTDPASHATVYKFDIASKRMKEMTDALSHTTSWDYDSSGRVIKITRPEGNYTSFTYDARGNVTDQHEIGKAGSGIDIHSSASYDASCSNPVTCNQPNTTTDAMGNVTNYTYNATHGGVTAVTAPAPSTGAARPETRYGYSSLQAYYKNSGGTIVASGVPVYRMTSVSQCVTGSSCAGTAAEVKTVIGYGPQTAGTGNNLLPVSVSTGSGDGALTAVTATGYDDIGNAITVDGPLSGSADTTRYRYDLQRRLVGVTSPDPDGAGSLKPRATRFTRDGKGRVTLAEAGNVNSQSDGDWTGFAAAQAVATEYDGVDRKTRETLKSGSTSYAVTQYGYDTAGRLECTAVRMKSATWSSLPAACTATTGTGDADRISKTSYDNANRPTGVETAYGTADAATESVTYNNNGTVATVVDGNNNKTTYEYDGVDRLVKTRYPSTTLGAGTSSTTDYEQLTYDASSNVTNRRLRDGTGIAFTYDKLDRLTLKDVPGTAFYDYDISYTYDNLGRLLTAANAIGNTSTFLYDALGRVTSEADYHGTKTFQYDLAGRRTELKWSSDNLATNYDYLVTGEVSAIRENGATSGIGVLASYSYDQLGRRTGVTRGNGTSTSYTFDAVSRLASLAHDLSGTASDVSTTFAYNNASQIAGTTRNNDAYAWSGGINMGRYYPINGLNQVTSENGTALIRHDARGNVDKVGSGAAIGYTAENRMTGISGSLWMAYDPLGRLIESYPAGGVDTRFDYAGDQIVTEIDAGNWGILRRYVYGPGMDEAVVQYEGSGTTDRRWLHADERGSIVAVSNASGAKLSINSYDEWGVPANGNVGRFQYTGQAWLQELRGYYYKARIYEPTRGRFVQTDPIGYGDGLNLYGYVKGDPVNFVDPTGTLIDKSSWRCYGNCGSGYANDYQNGHWVARDVTGVSFGPDEIGVNGLWRWVSNGSAFDLGRTNSPLSGLMPLIMEISFEAPQGQPAQDGRGEKGRGKAKKLFQCGPETIQGFKEGGLEGAFGGAGTGLLTGAIMGGPGGAVGGAIMGMGIGGTVGSLWGMVKAAAKCTGNWSD